MTNGALKPRYPNKRKAPELAATQATPTRAATHVGSFRFAATTPLYRYCTTLPTGPASREQPSGQATAGEPRRAARAAPAAAVSPAATVGGLVFYGPQAWPSRSATRRLPGWSGGLSAIPPTVAAGGTRHRLRQQSHRSPLTAQPSGPMGDGFRGHGVSLSRSGASPAISPSSSTSSVASASAVAASATG